MANDVGSTSKGGNKQAETEQLDVPDRSSGTQTSGSGVRTESADADLGKDALAGKELSADADDEAHHCEATVPLLSKCGETEFGVVHGIERVGEETVTNS